MSLVELVNFVMCHDVAEHLAKLVYHRNHTVHNQMIPYSRSLCTNELSPQRVVAVGVHLCHHTVLFTYCVSFVVF